MEESQYELCAEVLRRLDKEAAMRIFSALIDKGRGALLSVGFFDRTDKQADFRAIRSKAEPSTGSALSLHTSEFALFVGLSQRTDNLFSCFNNFFFQRFLHQHFFFL